MLGRQGHRGYIYPRLQTNTEVVVGKMALIRRGKSMRRA